MASRFPENVGRNNDWLDQFCLVYKLSKQTRTILEKNDLNNAHDLYEVSDQELKEIGISLGQRKAILRGIKESKSSEAYSGLDTKVMEVYTEKISNLSISCADVPGKILDLPSRTAVPKTDKLIYRIGKYVSKMFGGKGKEKKIDVSETIGNLKVIRCILKETWRNSEHKIRKCVSGEVTNTSVTKTIFVVGASGSGKSTLLDGMVNHIFNVDFKGEYRMKLVDLTPEEKENASKGQSVSQTDWITVYTVPHSAETSTEYVLNIVDTPGFVDTRGVERDEQLVQQVKYFFENTEEHGVDMVNAICFVAPAPQSRLTATQKYVFNAILSMFGKDVKDNIYIMATFADGNTPPLIESVRAADVPYNRVFQFNNSALFKPTKIDGNSEDKKQAKKEKKITELFWDLGKDSFHDFLFELKKTEPKSLSLSAKVLVEREKLSLSIEHLQELIKLSCQKYIRLQDEQKIISEHESKVKENKNFTYEVDEEQMIKVDVPDGQFTTNCSFCHTTCHKVCKIKDDTKKYKCSAMDGRREEGTCRMCPNKCKWDLHFNQGYIFKLHVQKVKKTYFAMKTRYRQAKELVDDQMKILQELEAECKAVEKRTRSLIRVARSCLSELRRIALKPDPLTDSQYIELLIIDERRQGKENWEQRINFLEQLKERAEMMSVVQQPDSHKVLLETSLHEMISNNLTV